MDSNFRFRASGDTPQRPRGEAASHREPVATSERSSLRATLMVALSVSFSRNWRERWTEPSDRKRRISRYGDRTWTVKADE